MNAAAQITDPVVSCETTRPTDPLGAKLGQRVKEGREFRKTTQAALGAALGISSQQVSKYEAGADRLSAVQLYRIAQALNLEPLWFYRTLDAIEAGETPPTIDTEQRKLLEAFDAIEGSEVRRLLISFIRTLGPGSSSS